MKPRKEREAEVRERIDALVRRKLTILNLQLAVTVAGAALIVAVLGWTRTPLLVAGLIVGVANTGQGINLVRMLPAHLRMNRSEPASVTTINRQSLWTEIAFIVIWVAVTALLLWASARAPVA
ncbi:hypothetical protein ACU5AX_18845 [Sphingomonas sp. XXL09]|jgi:hypothetical protein|uniref:hypothetical protein n=1 Tax=Sphingomonas sp. XXL09 TaxID=3457787 RepID=UPI00406BCF50